MGKCTVPRRKKSLWLVFMLHFSELLAEIPSFLPKRGVSFLDAFGKLGMDGFAIGNFL